MDNIAVEVINLTKSYNNTYIFNNVNLRLEEGKIYGFIGPNGCGKSIFFKTICGFITADKGTIRIFGKTLGKDIDFPPDTGIIIESPGFLEDYSQLQNLKYLASINNNIDQKAILNALNLVGLDIHNKNKVKNFSLGMRQRLGIAQAIMENPKLLILDEPFNGLDKEGVKSIHALLKGLRDEGSTK